MSINNFQTSQFVEKWWLLNVDHNTSEFFIFGWFSVIIVIVAGGKEVKEAAILSTLKTRNQDKTWWLMPRDDHDSYQNENRNWFLLFHILS